MLAEVFNDGKGISKLKVEIYFTALEPFSIETIRDAVSKMICERVYPSFPKPAEIIQMIRGDAQGQALAAWVEVVTAISRVGNYESVRFADPAINGVIQFMGGWPQVCMWLESELPWRQKEFERLYELMKRQGGNYPQYLPGTIELTNRASGYDVESKIVEIGKTQTNQIEAAGK